MAQQGHTLMRGKALVGISATNRAASGIAEGDVVGIDLELDTKPRLVSSRRISHRGVER